MIPITAASPATRAYGAVEATSEEESPMRRIVLMSALVLFALGLGSLVPPQARAAQAAVVDCQTLIGTGRFSQPLRIGIITRPTIVRNCPGLSQGAFYNQRHFIFSLSRAAGPRSLVGAAWIPQHSAIAGVHPFVATTSGIIFWRSLSHGQSFQRPDGVVVRYIPSTGLTRGTYVLGVELLDSPLRAVRTPPFNLIIVP